MQQRETLQEYIYRDILIHIYEGELPEDSLLPTLYALCRQYQASDKCIRKVLNRLKENGYISTKRGRPARIIFSPKNTELIHKLFPAFICDKKVLYSFYEAMRILFPSIYTHASMSCKASKRKELSRLIPVISSDHDYSFEYVQLNIRFFKGMLSSEKNHLLIHIVQNVMRNTLLPATLIQQKAGLLEVEILQSVSAMRGIYMAMLEDDHLSVKKHWECLFQIAEGIAKKAVENYPDVPVSAPKKPGVLKNSSDFKYLLIAYDIYEKILEGTYPVGTLLPTISAAKNIYHTAGITIQTAYRVLSDLEIVKTINGRGTQVCKLETANNFHIDENTLNARRLEYLEAIEFLQIVCEDVIGHASSIPFASLKEHLEGSLNPSHRYSGLILCKYLMKAVNSSAIDTLYQLISRRLYWGGYLRKANGGFPPEIEHDKCKEIVNALEQMQTERAIVLIKELLSTLYSYTCTI